MRRAVTCVRSVELEVADPDRAGRFFVEPWGLQEVARQNGSVYLRGSSGLHHILVLHPSRGPARVRRVVFEAPSCEVVDDLHHKAAQLTGEIERPAVLETIPGGGYGFGLRTPTGQALAVVAEDARHADDSFLDDRPYKIAHFNFNEPEREQLSDFLVAALGFEVIDRAGRQVFLNADHPDHSAVVIAQSEWRTMNHLSFEMNTLDSVMRGAGRLRESGYPIEWGVGRHGCANNVFAYFAGPEEVPLEYTAEVLQVDGSYVSQGPEYWQWPPGRLDQWGVTSPHTQRWRRIQELFGFAGGDFRFSGAGPP